MYMCIQVSMYACMYVCVCLCVQSSTCQSLLKLFGLLHIGFQWR